jgi:protein-L-isoaspartate(D-aspartate) O-methyltransferase
MGGSPEPSFMTDERAKRFPLALADLVREPRKQAARPGEARARSAPKPALKAVAGGTGKTTAAPAAKANGTTVKLASATRMATPSPKAGAATAKPTGAGAANAVPKSAAKPVARPHVKPVVTQVANNPRHAPAVATSHKASGGVHRKSGAGASVPKPSTIVAHHQSGALRTVSSRVETHDREPHVAARKTAMNVALTGAHALASERVRERMVERLRANGITDTRVLDAMAAVPRHMFVDPGLAAQAYEDAALPIGHHQTISKPSVVARMIELVATGRVLKNVLEIGTGCGYQAAVLSQIATEVYSIERIRPLSERAKLNLRPLRVPNIRLHYGDGRLGLPAAAPFDAIVIACAGLDVPQALLDQLAIGGRLVAPVGSQAAQAQILTLVERVSPTQWRESQLDRVFFVPLKSGVI